MKHKKITEPTDIKLVFILLVVAVIAISVDLVLNFLMAHTFLNNQKTAVTHELGAVRARLEEQMNTSFSLVYGMVASLSSHPDMASDDFDALARNLLKKNRILKNIGAAPDFVIHYMYPLEHNEKALGLDYRTVPGQWSQALAAKETGEMVLAGPINLVQGGKGLIARVPVFRDDTGDFWGLVSAVMDFHMLLDQAGISSTPGKLTLAIRGKDSNGAKGEVIWGEPRLFDMQADSVTMPVSVPSGSWEMAAIPVMGWGGYFREKWLIHMAVFLFTMLIVHNVAQQRRNRRQMIERENQLKAMSRSSHDALVMIDSDDRVTFWNQAAEAMFGFSESEIIGKSFHKLVCLPEEVEKAIYGLKHFIKTGDGPVVNTIMEMTAMRKSGEAFPVERSVASFKLAGKWYAVGSMRDITVRKEYEKQLKELATTDALTGLPNRRHFMNLSEREFRKTTRYHNNLSLLMFDIDHFKTINDTYGHEAGDQVLQYLAATVKNAFRETDIPGRIGGEEFAVTMPETDLMSAVQAAERLRIAIMAIRVKSGKHSITLTVSIGVVQWNTETSDTAQMLKRADELLYKAKRGGRNKVES